MPRTNGVASQQTMLSPDKWLAVLRIVVGFWFVKSVLTKITIALAWGVLPVPAASDRRITTMPRLIMKYAAANPFSSYRFFLLGTVVPHARLFATLTGLGEVVIGIGLTFGLFTVLASAIGLVQVVFYGLAVQHTSPGQQGFHILLFVCMVAFMAARAGRKWGVDGWLRARRSTSALARLPLG